MKQSEPLGLLLDHTQDKIALLTEDGTFTYVNGAAERLLGFGPDDLVGANAFDFVHSEDVADVRRAFERAVRDDAEFAEETVEYRHRHRDGSWVWLESRMSNLTDAALEGYVISSRDVTDRVRAEREHAETASRLEQIAAVAGDVLWLFDADWSEVLFVNPAYEEIFGGSVEDAVADPDAFLDTIHPDDRPAVVDAMGCLSAGNSVEMEYRVNPDTEYARWVWVQAEPIEQDGEVVRIAGFARDITDRRRRERQLVVMDNLLRHNLRNDLNVVLGKADLIQEELPEASEHTTIIRRVSEELLQTAEKERHIIDLLTEQEGRDRFDLRETVGESVSLVREHHPDATIEIEATGSAFVRARPELGLAVIELLENAIQHGDGDPTVRLELTCVGAHAELTVADDHPPIPTIEADVLTGDHDMTNVYHSSGLGFWLVYWAVELSNGHVAVNSGAERGNRITLSIPLDRTGG